MDRTTQIILIGKTYTPDSIGQYVATEVQKTVFADLKSISRNEYYAGGEQGLRPEFVFVMNSIDYSGQDVILYNGKRYAIYRTYFARNDDIELYVQLEGGA